MLSSENLKAPLESVRPQTSSAQADLCPSDKALGAFFIRAYMGKDPAVLFYTSDFMSGTYTMSNEHVGMYIRLLCLQHQKGRLNERDMLHICQSYVEDVFLKFQKDSEGFFFNKRLQEEMLRREAYSESRRKNRFGGGLTYVRHMETENRTENKAINKKENEKKSFGETGIVKLTDQEFSKLVQKFGQAEAEAKISRLENGICSKGYKYKSHYHTILNWAGRDGVKSADRKIRGGKELIETADKFLEELKS